MQQIKQLKQSSYFMICKMRNPITNGWSAHITRHYFHLIRRRLAVCW